MEKTNKKVERNVNNLVNEKELKYQAQVLQDFLNKQT